MNCLITGINGSGPSYLAEHLITKTGLKVSGLGRYHSESSNRNLVNIKNDVSFYECDLTDMSAVLRTLSDSQPDMIFHMASTAKVKSSFSNPLSVLRNNIDSTANLLEAIRILKIKPTIHFCGTSEVYGQVRKEDTPIKETHRIDPVNVYAISKLTQEGLVKSYWRSFGIPVVITRAFTYINPRRPDIFSSAFVRQIVEIEKGKREKLFHGNLDSTRTMVDVRDIVEAYWLANTKCDYGEAYNIGGTYVMKVGEFLELLRSYTKCSFTTEVDPELMRPVDVTMQIPDTTKFVDKTGWVPKYTLDESIQFLFDYFRKTI